MATLLLSRNDMFQCLANISKTFWPNFFKFGMKVGKVFAHQLVESIRSKLQNWLPWKQFILLKNPQKTFYLLPFENLLTKSLQIWYGHAHWGGAQCGKVNLGENSKLVAMVTKLFTKNILLAAI